MQLLSTKNLKVANIHHQKKNNDKELRQLQPQIVALTDPKNHCPQL